MIKGPRAESFQLEVPPFASPHHNLELKTIQLEVEPLEVKPVEITSTRALELSLFSSRSPPFASPHHDLELKTIQLEVEPVESHHQGTSS
ncbi:hypothetical protein PGT21_000848 [Puccinia graminis f. sp. tritici]|uniref:Uncharacterized protein n=1 Tax=Puccinia graminis f. sp. tritici TaxID=56615 RepID=A0A5B0NIZ0_PUCGR|nr:hypothetical protein PGT21_000848 [Puccinia graminis f. sp. tritici]